MANASSIILPDDIHTYFMLRTEQQKMESILSIIDTILLNVNSIMQNNTISVKNENNLGCIIGEYVKGCEVSIGIVAFSKSSAASSVV